ncbi:MAG: tyrosine-type recombinase/integrase [Clostridia bacterium]|nr:tyrosine-type recombinase/integrase [Clostridia bacterium]
MPRKGENIYKRKDGRWEGRYLKRTPEGRSCYGYVYAATYRDAREKLRRAAVLWEGVAPRDRGTPLLLASMARRWQDSLAGQVKDSTYVKYHVTLTNHILPQLGQISVEDISHEVIEAFAARLLRGENGQPLSPRTVSDILSVLRSILRFARRSGASVPCDGSDLRIRRPTAEIRVLTRQEQQTLCLYLYNNRSLRNAGILLSLFAGLRVGEVCALRWEDIDLPGRMLHVRHTMQRIQNLEPEGPRTRVVITAPKSVTSTRTIPLTEDLARILSQLPGEHRGYLLTGQEDRFSEPRIMQNHFRKIVEAVGMENANYHALRHTFATRCVELGFDVKSLSELLGHSTVSMTMDRYVHPSLEHKRENLQRLSTLIPPIQFPDAAATQ